MAGTKEIAIGVATALSSAKTPNPLFIDLWNEMPDDAGEIVQAVVNECIDAGVSLSHVAVDPVIHAAISPRAHYNIRGVVIAADAALTARIAFYRPA